jgi:tetratricopeptide (TPR) repeat protein
MVLHLDTLLRKAAVAGLATAATMGLSLPLWAQFRVARLSAQGTQESLEAAVAIQPRNAELHNRLGRVLLYSPLGDATRTMAELQRAIELDPRNGAYWMDLALAREINGDVEGASAAIRRARAAEPHTPALLWHEANFDIRRGRLEPALGLLRELMQHAPEYTGRVLPLFSRVTEPATLVGEVVPATRPAMDAALEFIRRENHVPAAGVAWDRLLRMEDPPTGQVRPFLDWLILRGEAELAVRVWQEAAEREWIPIAADTAREPLYNGDLRHPLEDFGFDWRVLPHPEASVWMEGRGPEPGLNSLCVQFNPEARENYAHIVHYLPVQPDYHYSLRAAMRSDRLAARAGAFLQISDPLRSSISARTDAVTGSNGWRDVLAAIQTGPDTRMLAIRLARPAPVVAEEPGSGLVCIARLEWSELGPKKSEVARGQ